MKIPYFCCIGAELKRYAQDFDFMNQVYLYKVPTDDSIDEVLTEDYFKAISNSVLQDDIVYIYEASAETLHECRFNKQNGHITAVPLASDETLTGAVTSIIHDNLTPNKLLKSDGNGKVAASDFSENDFVKADGTSIMTAPLKFMSGSVRGAVGPYFNGVGFWKLDSQANLTQIASISDSQFIPTTTSAIDIGNSTKKWKDLYLSGTAYMATINNRADISVPQYGGVMVVAEWGKTVQEGQMLSLDRGLQPVWVDVATVATTGDYNDLRNKPTIPTVGDGTITITQGGTTKGTFTVNQSGNTTIDLDAGGGTSNYHPDLFDWKWADHTLNDVQWLRADTFSWQSGSVYEAAFWDLFYDIQISTNWYREGAPGYTAKRYPEVGDTVYLNSDLTTPYTTVEAYDSVNDTITAGGNVYTQNGNTYVTPTNETVSGYTVSVYTGHSGKKITIPTYETAVSNIYSATGVAWYYIIDIPNKRFKLPRTKFGVTGLRDTVGNYVAPGVPNLSGSITRVLGDRGGTTFTGVFTDSTNDGGNTNNRSWNDGSIYLERTTVNFDASDSSSIYGNSTTVQPPATQMYLYFYVGEFTQTALENTAGLNAELFNDKADTDLSNVNTTGKAASVSWGRQYTQVNTTIATGNSSIAGTYTLGFTDNKVKIGLFECQLRTTQPGFSYMSISTDVETNPCAVAGTNNQFASCGTIAIPFVNSVTVSFPATGAGIGGDTALIFRGYM